MPRSSVTTQSKYQQAREYARTHAMSFDALIYLFQWANEQDGTPSRMTLANVPAEASLPAEDAAALAAARLALA